MSLLRAARSASRSARALDVVPTTESARLTARQAVTVCRSPFSTRSPSSLPSFSHSNQRISLLSSAHLASRLFSTSSSRLEAATAEAVEQQESIRDDDAANDIEAPEHEMKRQEITNEFTSLKGHIAYPTFKALTVKPFGYKKMSDVQYEVLKLLPHLADSSMGPMPDGKGGRDLIVKARTGTGKTIAFLTPAIESRVRGIYQAERGIFTKPFQAMLDRNRPGLVFADLDKHGRQLVARQFSHNTVGTVIISPTRELATQIATEARKMVSHHKDMDVLLLVGGQSRNAQTIEWRKARPDIVVATPGRLNDLLESEPAIADAMSACQTLIFDEADTLLDMGFKDEVDSIVKKLPAKADRNTLLFSATVSKEVRQIARNSMGPDGRFIDCVPPGEENAHLHIPQSAHLTSNADQLKHAIRLIALDQLQNPGKSKVIVFSNTTTMAQAFSDLLKASSMRDYLPCGRSTDLTTLHGKIEQVKRFRASDRFRASKSGADVLVTTDVSARGVDYPGVTRVIQLGPPTNADQYVHRIGRTGRAGAAGRADIVLAPFEEDFLNQISKMKMKVDQVSVDQVNDELQDLARRYDTDPSEFEPPRSYEPKVMFRGKRISSTAKIVGPLFDRMSPDYLEEHYQTAMSNIDEEERYQIFISQAGFIVSRAGYLNAEKMDIVNGVIDWAKDCLQMESRPYISPAMLTKLGVPTKGRGGRGGDSSSRFGNDRKGGRSSASRGGGFGGFGRRDDGFNSPRRGNDAYGSRNPTYERKSAFGRKPWDEGVSAGNRSRKANSRGGPGNPTYFHA